MGDKYGHNKVDVICKECNIKFSKNTDTYMSKIHSYKKRLGEVSRSVN